MHPSSAIVVAPHSHRAAPSPGTRPPNTPACGPSSRRKVNLETPQAPSGPPGPPDVGARRHPGRGGNGRPRHSGGEPRPGNARKCLLPAPAVPAQPGPTGRSSRTAAGLHRGPLPSRPRGARWGGGRGSGWGRPRLPGRLTVCSCSSARARGSSSSNSAAAAATPGAPGSGLILRARAGPAPAHRLLRRRRLCRGRFASTGRGQTHGARAQPLPPPPPSPPAPEPPPPPPGLSLFL